MSIFHNTALIGASGASGGGGAYKIERSLRFNRPDSSNLSRTFASAGSRTTWTFSCWVKRSAFGITNRIFREINGFEALIFDGNDKLAYYSDDGTTVSYFTSTAAFRDPSAWYHVVLVWNSANATATDRERLYVNGVRLAGSYVTTQPTLNQLSRINTAVEHNISSSVNGHDGYLADVHFIDGQALDPSSFGEFDTNNVWQPKAYSGTYGTNGFRLDFSDNSAATATTLGKDRAGSNNWTPVNLSVTAGAGNDSLVDSPTNYGTDTGAGGEVRGNYCTWNPVTSATFTLSNGNLDALATNAGGTSSLASTFYVSSGKWYAEYTVTGADGTQIGLIKLGDRIDTYLGSSVTNGVGYEIFRDRAYVAGVETLNKFGVTTTSGTHIFGIALNMDAGSVQIYKNGTLLGTLASGLSGLYSIAFGDAISGSTPSAVINFGQRPFAYTAPSGFKALCTQNLPTPTITNGATAMDVKLYTGNGSTQTISGFGFSPDFAWIKNRSVAESHHLVDQVRGVDKYLLTNVTDAEYSNLGRLTAFTSNGFTVADTLSTNAQNYVAWTWDAGSSTVTNTSGTISSQVRANASAGFSVVTYTGTGTAGTIGHGLNVAPSLIFCKSRSLSADWLVYHSALGGTQYIWLNLANAAVTDNAAWNNTNPTSSVFSVRTGTGVNSSGATYVSYCWAPVASYSAFGSYIGNGLNDGPFVYTAGFRPRWVMIKSTTEPAAGNTNWYIYDATRLGYNTANRTLQANSTGAEGNAGDFDLLSNGFKLRTNNGGLNTSAATYIYAAFAEHPFALARAR